MKNTNRYIALALCFTLALGVFAYRPSEAKAIAGVDDAVVIGALLSAFAGGCGLIFSNNGMTSGELAQSLTDKWNEFNEAAESGASSFAAWLGFEDTSALLGALSFSGSKLVIPRAVARKLSEFTKWLAQDLEISSDADPKVVAANKGLDYLTTPSGSHFYISNCTTTSDGYVSTYDLGSSFYLSDFDDKLWFTDNFAIVKHADSNGNVSFNPYSPANGEGTVPGVAYSTLLDLSAPFYLTYCLTDSNYYLMTAVKKDGAYDKKGLRYGRVALVWSRAPWTVVTDADLIPTAGVDADVRAGAPSGVKNPALDDENATPTVTGVGWDASTIEELLQQILAQVQANTLAPTIEGVDTETGGGTDIEEDAKPYLPYIPQIFEKIKELPGTLANIWESIKGIPAAIAEKIGAFFTTLWGWLQNIIDAITALPAAIAEKIGALFKPDEALLTEITDTFKGKFGFFSTLKQFGNDLFGMTPETEPPVIWVHLENAESKFGYNYGDKQKIFDMTWYQKYKASVDGLLSGFLWLGYLWLLFKRAPSILNGMQMDEDLRPPLLVGDVSSAPRLGAGDPSIHYGEGFTFRSKGGRRK